MTDEEAIQIATDFLKKRNWAFDANVTPIVHHVPRQRWHKYPYFSVVFQGLRPPEFEGPVILVNLETKVANFPDP